MEALLASLNDAQRAAVTSEANVLQVLAPPGSGKTKTLTARVSYLITACGYQPWNMLICTFTVKAAKEMRERITALVGQELARKLVLGTFHSVARRFLVSYGHYIGLEKTFGIADTSDTKAIIKRIVREHQLSIEPDRASSRISSQKARGIDAEHYAATAKKGVDEQEFTVVYREYQTALQTANLLDYDDLLLKCAFLLRTNPQCVANIQAVLIDEFQDTNEVQFDLMTLFAQYKRTITIVGDPDQSIYGWRNAEIKNLETMKVQYPSTLVQFLEENYRSSGAILDAAQAVIEQDESRPAKRLRATHGYGEQPILRRLPTAAAEARWLVAELKRTRALSGDMLQCGDYAILLRSASVSRHIETALNNAAIPYRMVGGTKFYDRAEVKILLDYLRVVNQPEHNDALLRVLNVPPRSIGEVTVKNFLDEAQRRKTPMWEILLASAQGRGNNKIKIAAPAEKGISEFINVVLGCRKKMDDTNDPMSPYDVLDFLIRKLKLEAFLKKKYPDDFEARWANIGELRAQTADLTAAMESNQDLYEEENLPQVEGVERRAVTHAEDALSVFLGNIALSSDIQKKKSEQVEESQCVTISTIHAAKGLEWPIVFIPACYTGCIPHSRAEDHDEERRLLYVGMTRAKGMLYLSCPSKNSQTQETVLSSFLSQGAVSDHFVAQGPSLEYYAISQLSKTLQRDCPIFEEIQKSRGRLEKIEDDKWPLDGSDIPEDIDELQNARGKPRFFGRDRLEAPSAPPSGCSGFVSAASITMQQVDGYSVRSTTIPSKVATAEARSLELQQAQENAALRKVDARANGVKTAGRKTKPTPSGGIAHYFAAPGKTRIESSSKQTVHSTAPTARSGSEPRIIAKAQVASLPRALSTASESGLNTAAAAKAFDHMSSTAMHRPRTIGFKSAQIPLPMSTSGELGDEYMFLSSSPPRTTDSDAKRRKVSGPDDGQQTPATLDPVWRSTTQLQKSSVGTFHATTMSTVGHATSTQMARNGRGRTLGLGRTFVPWNARKSK